MDLFIKEKKNILKVAEENHQEIRNAQLENKKLRTLLREKEKIVEEY